MTALADLQQSLRARGFSGTISWIARGFLRVNSFLVFHLSLERFEAKSAPPSGFELRKVTLDELAEIRAAKADLPVEFYCDRTHGFTEIFGCFAAGKLVAVHWLVLPGQRSRFLDMEEGEVELNFNTVLPEFRGQRLAQLLMEFVALSAKSLGYRHLLGVVHSSNIPQYKPMLDMGFRPIEAVEHFGVSRPKATLKFLRRKAADSGRPTESA